MAKRVAREKPASRILDAKLYSCPISDEVTERELSVKATLVIEEKARPLALYAAPAGTQVWLTDFSWTCEDDGCVLAVGRLTAEGRFSPFAFPWDGSTWSPSRPVRIIEGEAVAVNMGEFEMDGDCEAALSLRFTEEPMPHAMKATVKQLPIP